MSAETLTADDLTDLRCPHCDGLTDDATATDGDDSVRPKVGDPTICAYCTGIGIYTEHSIRRATADEMTEFRTHPEFRQAVALTKLLHMLTRDPAAATVIDLDPDTLPESLQEMLAGAIDKMMLEKQTREIRHFVTPEVANHVLSSYGNEDASMPSVATGALISLIRLCHESDDQMMSNLNDVEDFHGYVLAVALLAEGPDGGMEILEKIAGLRPLEQV